MRKITIVILAAILAGIMLCGALVFQKAEADSTIGFETLSGGVWDAVWVVYDRETGVMYAMSNGTKNMGTMTLMVNPDGTPRVYEGFAR